MLGKLLFYPIDIEVCTLHFRYVIALTTNTTALLQLIASGNLASTCPLHCHLYGDCGGTAYQPIRSIHMLPTVDGNIRARNKRRFVGGEINN